jgi:hypothetical protein
VVPLFDLCSKFPSPSQVRDEPRDTNNGLSHGPAASSTQVRVNSTYYPAPKARIPAPALPAYSSNGLPFRLPLPPNLAAVPRITPTGLQQNNANKQPQVSGVILSRYLSSVQLAGD